MRNSSYSLDQLSSNQDWSKSTVVGLFFFLLASTGCPRAEEGEVESPSLSETEVEQGLTERGIAVDGCISRARTRDPHVSGRVIVSGTIGVDGRVADVSVLRSNVGDSSLEDCIVRATSGARFAEAGTETPFRHMWEVSGSHPQEQAAVEENDWALESLEDSSETEASLPVFRPQSIAVLAERHSAEFDACYAAAVERAYDLEGDVVVTWGVEPSGEVRGIVVKGEMIEGTDMADCISSVVRSWRFEPFDASIPQQASFDLKFRQREE